MEKIKILVLFLFCLPFFIFAQDNSANREKDKPQSKALKREFRGVALLESYEAAINKLKADNTLMVDPHSDFGEMDEETPALIKAKIPNYCDHVYYQFYKNKLFAISLFWNKERYDYLLLYHTLKGKYGKPQSYNSKNAIWEDEKTLIILDNLPSIKYIDKDVFKQINNGKDLIGKDTVRDQILEDL